MLFLPNLTKNDFFVVVRISLFSGFSCFLVSNWIWKFLGYHPQGLSFSYLLIFSVLFFVLFLFSEAAVRFFFLLSQSFVLIKIISKVRNFIPFNSKILQGAFILHFFMVESHFFNYGTEHVFFLAHILTFSMIRCFFMMPALLFCSLVGEAKSVQTFLLSEKLNHNHTTRKVHTGAAEALVSAAKAKIDPTKVAAAGSLAVAGFIGDRGLDNGKTVGPGPHKARSLAGDSLEELKNQKVAQAQIAAQIKSDRDLLEQANAPPVSGFFGRFRSFSEPVDVQKTMAHQAELEKLEHLAETNRQAGELTKKHTNETLEFLAKTEDLEERASTGNVVSRGLTETADLFGFSVQGVPISKAYSHITEFYRMRHQHRLEKMGLLPVKQEESTSDLSSEMSSVLENFIF